MRLFCLLILSILTLSACNTMNGLGRDIEALGDGISNSAEKND
jgi:predicted small secreted protein